MRTCAECIDMHPSNVLLDANSANLSRSLKLQLYLSSTMLIFVLLDVTRTLVKEMKMATSADVKSKVSWISTFNPGYLPSPNIIHAGANTEVDSVTEKQLLIISRV